jgi:hypothetical protein
MGQKDRKESKILVAKATVHSRLSRLHRNATTGRSVVVFHRAFERLSVSCNTLLVATTGW